MTQATDPVHGNQIAGARAAVSKRVIRGDAGAHERARIHRQELLRNRRKRLGGSDHEVRVPAVVRNSRYERRDEAVHEISATARIAAATVPTVPADAYALSRFPSDDARAHRVNDPGDLVPGNSRKLDAGKVSFHRERVAVADATRLNSHAYLS